MATAVWLYTLVPDDDDDLQVLRAGTSLGAAVAAAEARLQGRAVRAAFKQQKDSRWAYEVEVVSGSKTIGIKVDAESGAIIAVTPLLDPYKED